MFCWFQGCTHHSCSTCINTDLKKGSPWKVQQPSDPLLRCHNLTDSMWAVLENPPALTASVFHSIVRLGLSGTSPGTPCADGTCQGVHSPGRADGTGPGHQRGILAPRAKHSCVAKTLSPKSSCRQHIHQRARLCSHTILLRDMDKGVEIPKILPGRHGPQISGKSIWTTPE